MKNRKTIKNNLSYYGLIMIPLLVYSIFFILPNITTLINSLYEWDGISPIKKFVGLNNYIKLFTNDPMFWKSLMNTVLFCIYLLIIQTIVGLALALLINHSNLINNVFRSIFFAPGILASIAVAYMWKMGIYDPNLGVLNNFLTSIGLESLTRIWIGEPSTAILSIVIVQAWMGMGFSMVLFIAGLNDIPSYIYESAAIDGANKIKTFFKITLPLLKNTTSVVLIITTINGFITFDLVYGIVDSGGAGGMTEVLATLLYRQGFAYSKVGLSSAIAVVLLIIVLIITGIQTKVFNKE